MPYVLCIIPARGGSKRVPRKNLMRLAGYPLLAHSVMHARQAELVHEVVVSTEDQDIAAVARAFGAEVELRPEDLADDRATSELALLHVLDARRSRGLADPDLVVFLQCTSPARRPGDIDGAIRVLEAQRADAVFSACENNRLIWIDDETGPKSLNYDYRRRQREQDMPRQFRENGSIYVFKPSVLREQQNRLGGSIAVYEMDYWSSFQLDTPEHAELLEWILRRPAYAPPVPWPERIDLVVFDFDGVMTDNMLFVNADGVEAVRCNRGDGLGVARLREAGVPMVVLSTESNPIVAARCGKLRLECRQDLPDKGLALRQYLDEREIDPAHVVYLGNDINDLPCLEMVGLPVVTADADESVRTVARLMLTRPGGGGAVRELCDLLLAHLRKETVYGL